MNSHRAAVLRRNGLAVCHFHELSIPDLHLSTLLWLDNEYQKIFIIFFRLHKLCLKNNHLPVLSVTKSLMYLDWEAYLWTATHFHLIKNSLPLLKNKQKKDSSKGCSWKLHLIDTLTQHPINCVSECKIARIVGVPLPSDVYCYMYIQKTKQTKTHSSQKIIQLEKEGIKKYVQICSVAFDKVLKYLWRKNDLSTHYMPEDTWPFLH